jgi:predicted dehydrogenase
MGMKPAVLIALVLCSAPRLHGADPMKEAKLIVLDPGHFHAALVQKDMYPWLSPNVAVYAPLGPDVFDYLQRIAQFNTRKENPASWRIDLHTGPDFFERMLREHPGNVVVLTGRNRAKIERLSASVDAGLNVLADKPWIIHPADLPKLEHVLNEAEKRGLVAYDIMTERFEITSILQRELVNDEGVFGTLATGSKVSPAVSAKSIHHLMKTVAGTPVRRPVWFFDIDEYGEGLADVGTHVVDLVQWTAFPVEKLDYRTDVQVLEGHHWPTAIPKSDFEKVTGEADFPPALMPHVKNGKLEYLCNNSVDYTVKGSHVQLAILWNWEAPPGSGDIYEARFRGSLARIDIRQGEDQHWIPELYVTPNPGAQAEVFEALRRKVEALQHGYPGVSLNVSGKEAHIVIPERYRVGHEAHFAQVTNKFFDYLKAPATLPAWEKPNMLVKYAISTRGVELSHSPAR